MGIKKNFFAPLASGLGATRRAAILLLVMMLTTATAWATDKTLSGSESYTAQDGDVLTGSTSGTVTIADNASITLSDVTITGGIVCTGTAEITLVGTNSVTGSSGYDPNIEAYRYTAGIQVGGLGTTLTIKGNGSLTANGALHSAGIGLSRAWGVDATGGDIVIEGGNITATGDGKGAGIGTGVCFGGDSDKTATLGNITIKGGTVRAISGTDNSYPGNGIGKGGAYNSGHAVVGTITIYDGIDLVDASSISESIVYMHETTDVTESKADYFTITEDGSRRVIFPKDDTDYTITIADGIEHGTIACEATTAKLGANVTITATPDQGYIFSRLVVKDAQNNDVESTGNSFTMPRSNVSVSAIFAEGSYNGTCGNGVYYAYDSSTNTLTISGTGAMMDYYDLSERPWDSYASDIQKVVIGAGVTSIGMHAFLNCLNLTTVTVYAPSCSLGDNAFAYCNELANIYVFSDKVASYKAATNWSTYAGKITGITGGYCGTTDHERDVVWALTGKSPNCTLTISGEGAMYNYDEYITPAPWNSYAEQIKEFVIENGVTSICKYAFYGTRLTSIEIPASVTSIGENAFRGCTNLGSVTFAEGSQLESIGKLAFNGTALTSIEIPASVTSIGENVFLSCNSLASMAVEDGNTVYDSRNGCNAIIETSSNKLIAGCKNSTIPDGVTSIGDYTFYGCTGLASIEIPASVTSIGIRAFQNCFNLATVTVYAPSCSLGEDAFADCGSLANIYVFSDLVDDYQGAENWSSYEDKITEMPNPNGKCGDNVRWALTGESTNYTLTISGTGAMANYASSSVQPWNDYRSSIKTVVIGNGVTSIGNYTFAKCTGLTSIEIPASVTSIGDDAFWDCSNLATVTFAEDSQLATIGISAFSTCRGLASVEIPAGVTSIGDNAFSTCNGLGSVTFAEGSQLTSIGNNAFQNCSNLTSITIPASVTSIGQRAFYGTGLTSIEIPASVTSIGVGAFANCSNLEAITVDGGNAFYDSRNGCNAIIEKSSNTLIAGCKNTTIPDGVTSIRNYSFYGCTGLTSIEIPASVTSIGNHAFENCSGLTGIEIPAGVTSIGIYAFANTGLTSIKIPAGVTSIGGYAFMNCPNLATVTVYAPSCTLGDNAFLFCNNLANIYVFNDLVDDYQAAENWSDYKGKITAIPTVTTSYVDADGTLHENVEAVPLNNAMTTLPAGWYVVNSDISYTGTITLNGNVNIILADGKTMTVTNTGTNTGDFAIYGEGRALHIYGQSQGTGALTATAVKADAIFIGEDDVAGRGCFLGIHGGVVTASTSNGIGIGVQCATAGGGIVISGGQVMASGSSYGIYCEGGKFDILGGQVTANGGLCICDYSDYDYEENLILQIPGVLTLGCSKATDFINTDVIDNYEGEEYEGEVKIAAGQTLVDDGGNIWSGTLSNDDLQNSLLNKTLRPVMGVVLTKDGSGNISAEFDGTSLETVSIPINITVNSVTLNRTFTLNKCATLMLPFSLGVGQSLNGGTLYKFDGVNNGEGDWVATLSEYTSPLKANTPYLIKPNGHMTDDKITFDLNGGTVTLNTTTAGEDSNEKDDLWDFIGTYSYIKWTSDTGDQDYSAEREAEIGKVYGFAAVEKTGIHVGDFVRVASGAKIRPMCAYLKWKGSIPNNAPALNRAATNDDTELPQRITVKLVSASGETTGIGTIDNGQLIIDNYADADGWYDLQGRKLSGKPTKKGLYINNGRKIVIK